MPQGCTILCLSNKTLSCNQDVTLVCYFKSSLQQDKTKEITHSSDSSVCLISKQYKMYLRITIYRLPVQDGGVEGHAISSSCKSTKIITSCWTTIDRRTSEPTERDTPCPKTKKKLQPDGRRGTITIKSNPIPAEWVTHNLENINTKEVLPLLWSFKTPHQASQPGDPTKGLGIPRKSDLEGQWDLITRLPQDWGKQRLQSWRTQTKFYAYQDIEERSSDSIGNWTKAASVGGSPVEVWVSRGSLQG